MIGSAPTRQPSSTRESSPQVPVSAAKDRWTLFAIIDAAWFPWVAGGTFLAGIVRGIAGFGGALVLIPILSAFLGPVAAVPILNAVDAVAAAALIPRAWRQCDWTEVAPLLGGALVLLPVGVMILKTLNASLLREITAIVLLLAVALMALGRSLVERRTALSSAGIGAVSGLMAGSIGLSGPPIALFWLDERMPPLVSRANVIVYTALMTWAVIALTVWEGLFNERILLISLPLMPLYGLGIWIGGHGFRHMSGRAFRLAVLGLVAAVTVATLIR